MPRIYRKCFCCNRETEYYPYCGMCQAVVNELEGFTKEHCLQVLKRLTEIIEKGLKWEQDERQQLLFSQESEQNSYLPPEHR